MNRASTTVALPIFPTRHSKAFRRPKQPLEPKFVRVLVIPVLGHERRYPQSIPQFRPMTQRPTQRPKETNWLLREAVTPGKAVAVAVRKVLATIRPSDQPSLVMPQPEDLAQVVRNESPQHSMMTRWERTELHSHRPRLAAHGTTARNQKGKREIRQRKRQARTVRERAGVAVIRRKLGGEGTRKHPRLLSVLGAANATADRLAGSSCASMPTPKPHRSRF